MTDLHEQEKQLINTDEIIAVMSQVHGLDVTVYSETFLAKSVQRRQTATALMRSTHYMKRLSEDPAEAGFLLNSLNVSYSAFFRNPLTFGLLEQVIFPALFAKMEASGQRELRIWSAGCAAGQEAWSVAILLDELSSAQGKPASYRIFATDHSDVELAFARSGVYPADALGNVRLRQLDGYFSRQGGAYAIATCMKEKVEFSRHDLLDQASNSPAESIYGDFDLVLCCNVLYYYRPEIQQMILDKLLRNIATDGYLVTGETERQIVAASEGLAEITPPVSIFQRRRIRR